MFRWLTGRRDGDENRLIFRYRDGKTKRAADPIAVEQTFVKVLGREWLADLRTLSTPTPRGVMGEQLDEIEQRREKIRQRTLDAVCVAFGVTRFKDEGGQITGLTEVELLDLLGGYLRFCNALRELARPFATAQSRASPSTGSRPTVSGSEPTSTVSESQEPATSV